MARMAIAPLADAQLDAALMAGARLVQRATAPGLAFALDELGDITIPDPVADHIDKAQLRALASLYLAADLEPAGIIPSVEALAGVSATGGAAIDLGAAEALVAKWWQHRSERLSADERAAFFSRLFGTSIGPPAADANRNFQFEDRMLELCEALYKLDETPAAGPYGDTAHQSRVRSAARALAQNLGAACTGVTAYMAGEIAQMLKEAFAILGHADLRHNFGARDVWGVIAGIARVAHLPAMQPQVYVRRGKAGLIVLAWLADNSDNLAGMAPLVTVADPVVTAAAEWLEATLTLGESASSAAGTPGADEPAATPRNPPPPPQGSSWAALGR